MDLLTFLLLGAIFLFVVSLVGVLYLAWSNSRVSEKRAVRKRLLYISAGGRHGREKLDLYKNSALGQANPWERWVLNLPRIRSLDRKILRSNLPLNATTFILFSLGLGAICLLAGLRIFPAAGGAVAFGLLGLLLPYLWLGLLERKALARFEEQLPETLDLLGRALRSGHALSSGFEIVVEDMTDPIRSEFAAMVGEIHLGLSMKEALENFCDRVPSRDLRFFAISIMIQKETGGNLAEIMDKISSLIRQRVQFRRTVDGLTAEGRLSAFILLLVPV